MYKLPEQRFIFLTLYKANWAQPAFALITAVAPSNATKSYATGPRWRHDGAIRVTDGRCRDDDSNTNLQIGKQQVESQLGARKDRSGSQLIAPSLIHH
jgi:hypothetical protein